MFWCYIKLTNLNLTSIGFHISALQGKYSYYQSWQYVSKQYSILPGTSGLYPSLSLTHIMCTMYDQPEIWLQSWGGGY